MINTAPDEPFGGVFGAPADAATTGQVMQFRVSTAINIAVGDISMPMADLVLDNKPGGVDKLGNPDALQSLALGEEASQYLCVVVNAITNVVTHVPGDPLAGCTTTPGSMPFAPKAALLG